MVGGAEMRESAGGKGNRRSGGQRKGAAGKVVHGPEVVDGDGAVGWRRWAALRRGRDGDGRD